MPRLLSVIILVSAGAWAQTPKDVRAVAKQGSSAIPTVAQYLNSAAVDTRVEAVKQLISLGGKDIIDPLIRGTQDADAEVQIRSTDGLVNYYLPGYIRQGLGSSVIRAGASLRAKFSDNNDQIIDGYVLVRADVISALGRVARGGVSMDARANGCRAVGILRGQAALPDLVEALRTKDNRVMYESLIAMQKIRDPAAGPRIVYLLRDLDDKVQAAAIETAGLLRTKEALPALRDIVRTPRNGKSERAALGAIALMPDVQDRPLLNSYLGAKDDKLRADAAEGLGRFRDPSDRAVIEKTWKEEEKMLPRLAAAFGLVEDGDLSLAEEAPFRYLVNTLNQVAYREVAAAYLTEIARTPTARFELYKTVEQGSRDEKVQVARILAASGDEGSLPTLEKISRDTDTEVSQEGLRALRSLKARLKV